MEMALIALRARPQRRALPNDNGERSTTTLALHVLDRKFKANQPSRKWIANFHYVWKNEGWLFVATVIDFF